MRAFLTSGRLTSSQAEKFKELIGTPTVKRALFITTAAVPYGLAPKPKWLEDSLVDMGQFVEAIDETTLEEGSFIPDDLSQYGFIFVSGGNSFYLAYRLHKTAFSSKIKDFIARHGVYSGSSAGALILMDDIAHFASADDPTAAPKIYPGLSLVKFAVVPHADSPKYMPIMNGIANSYRSDGKELFLLRDDQVLVINEGTTEMV